MENERSRLDQAIKKAASEEAAHFDDSDTVLLWFIYSL